MSKDFDISDVLTITTGRLVCPRKLMSEQPVTGQEIEDVIYSIDSFLRCRECEPHLRERFPDLFPGNPHMDSLIDDLDRKMAIADDRHKACAAWVKLVCRSLNLPRTVAMDPIPVESHTHIDPVEEAHAMVGDDRVIVVNPRSEGR